jgi:hypothetical protein
MQFGANTLGHLLFIRKLYHLLVSCATPKCPTRVIWASSSLHSRCTSPFNYDALRDTPARSQKYITPQTLYESSKFAIAQLGLYMSRTMFVDDSVLMIVVDPCAQVENSSMKIVGQVSTLALWSILTKGLPGYSLKNRLAHPSADSSLPTSTRAHMPRPNPLNYRENTWFRRSKWPNPPQLLKTR